MRPGGNRPTRRPRWWPDDEPWPPVDAEGRPAWTGGPPWAWHRGGWGRPGSAAWGRGTDARRGFGRLFGIVFLVALSAVLVVGSVVLGALGLIGGGSPRILQIASFVVLVAGIGALFGTGRLLRGTAGTLDDLVDAARRLEAGDYAIRVNQPLRGPRPVRDLVRGFNTMAARLDADERQRRSLLADVSHELRTPLAVVQGNLEAIIDGVHPADDSHLSAILDETRVVSRLVDDLRTLALSESGTLPLHREPTDLGILIAEVAASFRAAADAAGVAIEVEVDDSIPLLDVDPVRTREVLVNLLANALRYTPSGGSIRVAARPEADGSTVRVAVRDSGSGIAPDLLPHVFDRFWKSPESRGSGLGLAIARHLVEAHGGEIGAASQPGQGATVWFRLPLR